MTPSAAESPETQAPTLRSFLYRRSQLWRIPKPEPLIGPLHASTYAVLAGRHTTMKSFYALDLALHLATGSPYDGQDVRQTRVLYVAAEGGPGMDDRVQAWEEHHGVKVPDEYFCVLNTSFSLYRDEDLVEEFRDMVKEDRPGLIVLDTLRRMSGGANENDSSMGEVIDEIIAIRELVPGSTILVVAHTTKEGKSVRGYSGIEDDADTVLYTHLDNARTLTVTHHKNKYGTSAPDQTLRAQPVGPSQVLVPVEPEAPEETFTDKQQAVLDALTDGSPRRMKEIENLTGLAKGYATVEQLVARRLIVREGKRGNYTWRLAPSPRSWSQE